MSLDLVKLQQQKTVKLPEFFDVILQTIVGNIKILTGNFAICTGKITICTCKFTIGRGKFTDIIVKLPYNNGNFTHKIVIKKCSYFTNFDLVKLQEHTL